METKNFIHKIKHCAICGSRLKDGDVPCCVQYMGYRKNGNIIDCVAKGFPRSTPISKVKKSFLQKNIIKFKKFYPNEK